MGRLVVVTGPMYAGKSTKLLDEIDVYDDSLLVKPSQDNRYAEEEVVTHDGRSRECVVVPGDAGKQALLQAVREKDPDAIGADEVHFFDDWLVEAVEELRDDINVIIAGLNEDFRGERFAVVSSFLEKADDVLRLRAECERCGDRASKSQRLIDGEPAPHDSPTVVVGGEELYEARCEDCHTVPGR